MLVKAVHNKRGSISIPVVVIVFLILTLAAYSLMVFGKGREDSQTSISPGLFLRETYVKEQAIRLYVDGVTTESIRISTKDKELDLDQFKKSFLEKIREGYSTYPEMQQLEGQLSKISYSEKRLKENFVVLLASTSRMRYNGENYRVAEAKHQFLIDREYSS